MTPAILFDDGRGQLAPLTDFRPAFDVRTGAFTTLERMVEFLDLDVLALHVPPALEALARLTHGELINREPPDPGSPVLLLNGRCPLPLEAIDSLIPGQGVFDPDSGDLVAARLPLDQALGLLRGEAGTPLHRVVITGRLLISRPWHVVTFRDDAIDLDLETLAHAESRGLPEGVVAVGEHEAAIDPGATVYPGVVLVCEKGPVVIASGAVVRPGAVLNGPAYVGEGTVVFEHALIKAHTALGPQCRIGGEVGGTIVQGHSNKAHEGHLGDSWVGEWVNLGAGTTNSNLLNTYGEVTAVASPGGVRERTGGQFLGAVIGDHVKTAIGTRIMTGAVMHAGTMWAASEPVAGCVAPFTWATDAGRTRFKPARFEEVMRAMMSRRGVEVSEACLERVKTLMEA